MYHYIETLVSLRPNPRITASRQLIQGFGCLYHSCITLVSLLSHARITTTSLLVAHVSLTNHYHLTIESRLYHSRITSNTHPKKTIRFLVSEITRSKRAGVSPSTWSDTHAFNSDTAHRNLSRARRCTARACAARAASHAAPLAPLAARSRSVRLAAHVATHTQRNSRCSSRREPS